MKFTKRIGEQSHETKLTYKCAITMGAVVCSLLLGDFAGAQEPQNKSGGERATADRTITQPDGSKTFIVRLKDGRTVSFGEDGGGGLIDKDGSIIIMNLMREHVAGLLKESGRSINEILPAETIGKQKRSLVDVERTSKGNIQRYSDGSTLELRPDVIIESLPDGTKIEKLPEGSTIVRWPDGRGFLRNADGTGADLKPDGSIVTSPGTIEVLPGGIIRQTLKDDGVVIDKFQDGTVRSRRDLAKALPQTISRLEKPVTNDLFVKPQQRPISMDSTIVTRTQPERGQISGTTIHVDPQSPGMSKTLVEKERLGEKMPASMAASVPASAPSIRVNLGGGKEASGKQRLMK